ncbi:HAD-IA family hydrolase [Candidatus Parcubacteria bacterium]|nr:HAD-IA family hydrolase [Candidatus Parcubacteria bacterium]
MGKRNKIQGIIFDLGGVLVDDFGNEFFKNASKQLKVPIYKLKKIIKEEESLLQQGKETSIQFWHRICKKLKIACPSDKILISLLSRTYKQNVKIKKNVIKLVKYLRKRYFIAILSNTTEQHSAINRKRKLFGYFDVVLLSNEVGFRKPQKEFFNLASKKFNVPFRNLLFIDDEMRWIRAAKKLGLQTILFKSSIQLKRALEELRII